MALETLNGVSVIGGFQVKEHTSVQQGYAQPEEFVWVRHHQNTIEFKIQNGPIKENGVNGCQVDTLIHAGKKIIEGLNAKYPCRENAMAITKLDECLMWLEERTKDREARGVEGKNEK